MDVGSTRCCLLGIAYIPLRRKNIRFGYWRWLGHTFALPNTKDTSMLQFVSFALDDASQWNIGCVGSQTQIYCVGHVHFFFFV